MNALAQHTTEPSEFIKIAAANEKLRSKVPALVKYTVPVKPDAIIYNADQAVLWINSAQPKSIAYYHFGAIAVDQARNVDLAEKRMFFALLSAFGLVWPRQKRAGDQLTHYYAIRCDETLRGMPRNVLSGSVRPSEYIVMRAISERQASQSVARCIRESLDVDDTGAGEMRRDLIRRGWITNDRKPAITDLGYSVLD